MIQIKNFLRLTALTLSAVSLLGSCVKEDDKLMLNPKQDLAMTLSQNEVAVQEEKFDEEALKLTWSKADFGTSDLVVDYTLEVKTKGGSPVTSSISLGSKLSHSFTHKALNRLATQAPLNLPTGEKATLLFQIVAKPYTKSNIVLNSGNSVKSNLLEFMLTPIATNKPIPDSEKMGIGIVGDAVKGWPSGEKDFEKDVMLDPDKDNPHLWKRENVELIGGKKLKFRKDHSWAINWGQKGDVGFPKGVGEPNSPTDLVVTKGGKYTVTFNDETAEFEFVRTGDLDKEPEPTPQLKKGVSLIGSAIGGWKPANDIMLAQDENNKHLWTAKGVAFVAGEFKFRLDQAWTKSWGKGDTNSEFPKGVAKEGSNTNFKLEEAQAGTYDVTFNDETLAFEFTKQTTGIGIIGDGANGWNDDVMLTQDKTNKHLWTGKVTLIGGKSIKFRKDHQWTVNWGNDNSDFPEGVGAQGKGNILIPADKGGEYSVTFNDETGKYVFTLLGGATPTPELKKGVSLIGSAIGGWNTENDVMFTQDTNNKNLWKATDVKLKAGEFKFRLDQAWGTSWGKGDTNSGFPQGVAVSNKGNFKIEEAQAGTYDVTFNDKTGAYTFTKK